MTVDAPMISARASNLGSETDAVVVTTQNRKRCAAARSRIARTAEDGPGADLHSDAEPAPDPHGETRLDCDEGASPRSLTTRVRHDSLLPRP